MISNLFDQLLTRQAEADQLVNDYQLAVIDFADAQCAYDVAVSQHTRAHKLAKTPATLIKDIVRGEVAGLRRDMVIAEGKMKAADKRELNNRKMLTLLQASINKDWETL